MNADEQRPALKKVSGKGASGKRVPLSASRFPLPGGCPDLGAPVSKADSGNQIGVGQHDAKGLSDVCVPSLVSLVWHGVCVAVARR